MIPSTRETIDLTFDDENDTKEKKKEASTFVPLEPLQTVALRKQLRNNNQQEDTPSRLPSRRRKSPIGEVLPATRQSPDVKRTLPSSIMRSPSPKEASLAQIPDSEGEGDDEFGYGDDLHSDDIPVDTKEILCGTSTDKSMSETNDQDNIIPESPPKVNWNDGNNPYQYPSETMNTLPPVYNTIARSPMVLFN